MHSHRRARDAAGDTHLIVFAKAPIAGLAKTRLIPALGAAGAARLAARLLRHAVRVAVAAQLGPVELCVTPTIVHPAFAALHDRHGVRLRLQRGADLGERMCSAFERCLPRHGRVLLIGTDAPALDAARLRRAAAALADHDAVFVPALDGGYALVGLRRPAPQLFSGIAWSTSAVMRQTRERAAAMGLGLAELEPVADIDEPADLLHLPAPWQRGLAPAASAYSLKCSLSDQRRGSGR